MTQYSDATIWTIVALLGLGTFLIRFSFLGLIGARRLPRLMLRLLRYTPVAVLPGIAAPLVATQAMTDGGADPAKLAAAAATLVVGWWLKNVLYAILAGIGVLATGLLMAGAL